MARTDDLDWDDLRYFLLAARAGTLAGAARAAGVEHSTIGRRLSALERSLGAPLVLRGPEGLKLTQLGEELARLAEEVERAVIAVRDLAESRRERVLLAVPSGFTGFLTERIAKLREERPKLTVEILSGQRFVDLKRGEADLALRIGPVTDQDLVLRKLCEVGWSLYASERYLARHPAPADPADLTGHDVIVYEGNLTALPAAKWIAERALKATIALRVRETLEMVRAVTAGAGLAVLPCYLADAERGLIRVTPMVVGTRNLSLVYRRESRLSEPVRIVSRCLVDAMREHAEELRGTLVQRSAAQRSTE
jgi:DNA-binding transcriptional LysR family regulator